MPRSASRRRRGSKDKLFPSNESADQNADRAGDAHGAPGIFMNAFVDLAGNLLAFGRELLIVRSEMFLGLAESFLSMRS
jgi:hypothetical protein